MQILNKAMKNNKKSIAWLSDNEIAEIFSCLNKSNDHEISSLFVGGCVRNAILGRTSHDIDIATRYTPEQVISLLRDNDIQAIPTGIAHGTVTAVKGSQSVEITTLRRDIRTDGRHADIAFTQDWVEDARRRDFTMNTLLADREGHVYDPLGCGVADLKRGRVIFVGDAETRIREDYLRILRFFRFHAFYGQGDPCKSALEACRKHAMNIARLSAERITHELTRLMMSHQPAKTIQIMTENNILDWLGQNTLEGMSIDCLDQVTESQKAHDVHNLPGRIVALAGANEDTLRGLTDQLVFSNNDIKTMKHIQKATDQFDTNIDLHNLQTVAYTHGNQEAIQAALIAHHGRNVTLRPDDIDNLKTWTVPKLPVSGKDLIHAGASEGEKLGRDLQKIEKWWIKNYFTPDKDACLAFYHSQINQDYS